MLRAALTAVLALTLGIGAPAAAQQRPERRAPKVVVSIMPFHSLVSGVMAGVGEPELLIKGTVPPHLYDLTPADARILSDARIIVWVGETLEPSLAPAIESGRGRAVPVKILDLPGTMLLSQRDASRIANPRELTPIADHGVGRPDPHVWLTPSNARGFVLDFVQIIRAADPDHAERYLANADALRRRLAALDSELSGLLRPVKDVPYVVHHDGYQYFERAYGLKPVMWLSVWPDDRPGLLHLEAVEANLERLEVRCIFGEVGYDSTIIPALIGDREIRQGTLDPIGAKLEPGADAYFTMMRRLARTFADCLGE